eukprot:scaffold2271_cov130-Cylindrotheca_fusiformis.AAC.6
MDELAYRKRMESRNSVAVHPTMDPFMLMQLFRRLPNNNDEKEEKPQLLSLYRTDLDYNTTYEIIDQLFRWSRVEMKDCHGDHMHTLLMAIMRHKNIAQLSLMGEALEEASINAIRDGIAGDAHGLQELTLTIDMPSGTTRAILSDGINNSSLAALDLSQCDFSPDSIDVLCAALQSNTTLKSLKFVRCRLEDDELARIVGSVENNQQLAELSLALNYAEDDTMLAICNLLRSSRSRLESLNLAQQNPGMLDFLSFADALRENETLRKIDLKESFVQPFHINALADALSHNSTVQELNLETCGITDSMLSILLRQLEGGSGLVKLFLRGNDCSKPLDASILKQNCVLQVLDIEQDLMSADFYFHLCLNRGGRQFLNTNGVPLSLWPVFFSRVNRMLETENDEAPESESHHGIGAADVLYYLLKGSVF